MIPPVPVVQSKQTVMESFTPNEAESGKCHCIIRCNHVAILLHGIHNFVCCT